jgi:putative two-component system response regulator
MLDQTLIETTNELNQLSILIIDDNSQNTLILSKMLEFKGYNNVTILNNSGDFIRVFSTCHPDLILLDIMMPNMDGYQILDWLRSNNHTCSVPVVVITALDDQISKQRALSLGARDFLVKPFDNLEVLTRVGNLLQIRMMYLDLIKSKEVLELKVSERTAEIESIQVEIIERLMRAAEFRDQDTSDHISRISQYVFCLSMNLGIQEDEAKLISLASKMHDIGKIGIPDQILLKPGKLDTVEMEVMKAHALKGSHILSESQYRIITVAEEIARTHHEKWDGSGYPSGLAGDNIPLHGRITAVADVLDALLSARPYKPAWEFGDAIYYITQQSGSHFDPQVVEALIRGINTIKLISKWNS